ncbi:PaaI family thioesterase [Aliiroseovarius sp. PTFE2010]|uniref:PaaI family thioesterase n=1 Tax=Aliiroseovarius sp. PTFE2010 TaxID=3417190 RepID=UPI003CF85700
MDPRLVEEAYPLQAHLGFRITEWSEGFSRFELPLEPFLMNRFGIPHGGVYATLLDTVMGYCGSYTGDPDTRKLAMTLSMTVNYLSRPKGKLLIGEGQMTGGGAKTFFADGIVTDETGEKVATASGTFRRRG